MLSCSRVACLVLLCRHGLVCSSAMAIGPCCEQARGATNAVLSLPDEVAARSIIAHSSGNHAQGVAFAASTRNLKAHVVMVCGTWCGCASF